MSAVGTAIIVPARYGSTRFPGKALATVGGRPLIEWVWRRASTIDEEARVIVATDDERIAEAVRTVGGEVALTGEFATGTDRVAEVAKGLDVDVVVNLQGDEPVFPVEIVRRMIECLRDERDVDIVTAAHPITSSEATVDPNVVKVVADLRGRALYFSRAPIPARTSETGGVARRHVGIYAFRKEKLLEFAKLPRTPLEESESLEQLRALENGMTVRVLETTEATLGVDVPGDLKNVEKALVSS